MKILGIDSSGMVASVAVVENKTVLAEYTTNYKKTHSQTLVPMLDEIKKMIDLDLSSIDAIAISSGPGSFTGLRIGSATAKGLGLALKKPLVEIPTLQGLAFNMIGTKDLICPIMDARREQVYTGVYKMYQKPDSSYGEWNIAIEEYVQQTACPIVELLEKLNSFGEPVVFLGDGVPVYEKQIQEHCRVPYTFAMPHNSQQRASSIGTLGEYYYSQGKIVSPQEHEPEYLRKSQAEREKELKSK